MASQVTLRLVPKLGFHFWCFLFQGCVCLTLIFTLSEGFSLWHIKEPGLPPAEAASVREDKAVPEKPQPQAPPGPWVEPSGLFRK